MSNLTQCDLVHTAVDAQQVKDFLIDILSGRTPVKDCRMLPREMVTYDFITDEYVPELVVPKTSDRLKAAALLMNMYGMDAPKQKLIEVTDTVEHAKIEHFKKIDTMFDLLDGG